jgi:hypothetical protein
MGNFGLGAEFFDTVLAVHSCTPKMDQWITDRWVDGNLFQV